MKNAKKPIRYGLSPNHTKYTSRELVDFDYVASLSPEAADWLDKFSREYYQNTFRKEGNLYDSKESRREIYKIDNARRRDVWTRHSRMPNDFTDFLREETSEDE